MAFPPFLFDFLFVLIRPSSLFTSAYISISLDSLFSSCSSVCPCPVIPAHEAPAAGARPPLLSAPGHWSVLVLWLPWWVCIHFSIKPSKSLSVSDTRAPVLQSCSEWTVAPEQAFHVQRWTLPLMSPAGRGHLQFHVDGDGSSPSSGFLSGPTTSSLLRRPCSLPDLFLGLPVLV